MSGSQVNEFEVEEIVRDFIKRENLDSNSLEEKRGKIFDAGLSRVEFPKGFGGRSWPRNLQKVVDNILKDEAGVEPLGMGDSPIGIGMAAPTLLAHGHPDIKQKMIREIFTGESIWCQMFSEPSAGSDVAGLSSRAIKTDEGWEITGQKVWTSWAHVADYGLMLARTDPGKPKHEGLSYFFVDMKDPNVEVRPLFQMTGDADFNEVFLNNVKVADNQMLGEEGDGWKVATTTLMNERDAIGALTSFTEKTFDLWEKHKGELGDLLPSMRDELVQLWIEDMAVAMTSSAARKKSAMGKPGPEGSVAKQAGSELQQRIMQFELELIGANALEIPEGYPMSRESQMRGSLPKSYLSGRILTIAGGTSEVMRNILAERILRMPADLRIDKDVPWEDIPRG